MIDQMFKENFLNKELFFETNPELDMDKLIVAGHSFGGATAIKTGLKDRRVKCVLTMDPWFLPIKKTIENPQFKGFGKDFKFLIINSEDFTAVNHEKHLEALDTVAKGVSQHESISILESGHQH